MDIDYKIEQLLKIKKELMIKDLKQSHLYIWEQVILISIYARSLYKKNRVESTIFINRMKMVDALNTLDSSNESLMIKEKVIALLNEGHGMLKILSEVEGTLEKKDGFQFNVIKRYLEEQQVNFKPLSRPYTYCHFSLNKILRDPIEIYQQLLHFSNADHIFNATLLNVLNNRHTTFLFPSPTKDKRTTLEEHLTGIEKNPNVNLEKIQEMLSTELDTYIKEWMTKVVNSLLLPETENDIYGNKIFKNNKNPFEVNRQGNQVSIEISKDVISRASHLGEIEQLMSQLRNGILDKCQINREKLKPLSADYGIHILSDWYSKGKIGIIKRDNQIPRLIASILEFDVYYGVGFFQYRRGYLNIIKLSNKQAEDIVTKVIRGPAGKSVIFSH